MAKLVWLPRSIAFCCGLVLTGHLALPLVAPAEQVEQVEPMASGDNVSAYLDLIARAEGTGNRYDVMFTGKRFQDFSDHPRQRHTGIINGRRITSTAAGRYQFLDKTWDRIARKKRLQDFSPTSQDVAAIALIEEAGALTDVEAGDFAMAMGKTCRIWAGLPCRAGDKQGAYGQNPRSWDELLQRR